MNFTHPSAPTLGRPLREFLWVLGVLLAGSLHKENREVVKCIAWMISCFTTAKTRSVSAFWRLLGQKFINPATGLSEVASVSQGMAKASVLVIPGGHVDWLAAI